MIRSLLVSAVFFFTLSAQAAPFDWHKLFGTYHFQNCQNEGGAIWQTDPANQYIVISDDPFNTQEVKKNYLAAALFHEPFSPIVPIWELSDLDQGPVKTFDDKTGELQTMHENVTLADGVHSRMEWHFGDDSGWAEFELKKVDEDPNQLSYTMERHDGLSGTVRHESCRLLKTL